MRGDDVALEPYGAAPGGRRRARGARVASSSTERPRRKSNAGLASVARRAGVELRGSLAAAHHQQLHALAAISRDGRVRFPRTPPSEAEPVVILRFGIDVVGSGCPRTDRARGGHRRLGVPADTARPWKATCAQFRADRRFDDHLPRMSLGWSTTIRQTVYEVKPSASSCFEATRPGPTKRVSHSVGA